MGGTTERRREESTLHEQRARRVDLAREVWLNVYGVSGNVETDRVIYALYRLGQGYSAYGYSLKYHLITRFEWARKYMGRSRSAWVQPCCGEEPIAYVSAMPTIYVLYSNIPCLYSESWYCGHTNCGVLTRRLGGVLSEGEDDRVQGSS